MHVSGEGVGYAKNMAMLNKTYNQQFHNINGMNVTAEGRGYAHQMAAMRKAPSPRKPTTTPVINVVPIPPALQPVPMQVFYSAVGQVQAKQDLIIKEQNRISSEMRSTTTLVIENSAAMGRLGLQLAQLTSSQQIQGSTQEAHNIQVREVQERLTSLQGQNLEIISRLTELQIDNAILESRLSITEEKVKALKQNYNAVEVKLNELEGSIRAIKSEIAQLDENSTGQAERLSRKIDAVKGTCDEFRDLTDSKLDGVDTKLRQLLENKTALNQGRRLVI